jgi:hypothetical protein
LTVRALLASGVNGLVSVGRVGTWSPTGRAAVDAFSVQVRMRRNVTFDAGVGFDLGNAVHVVQWDSNLDSAHGLDDQHLMLPSTSVVGSTWRSRDVWVRTSQDEGGVAVHGAVSCADPHEHDEVAVVHATGARQGRTSRIN